MRMTGVTARGVIMPVFREGDPLSEMVCSNILAASEAENFPIEDGDIVAVTEAVVARTQGNYATTEQIAKDVKNKLGDDTIGLVFPIMSRNRFAVLLSAFASACKKLVVQLSYPSDEVGNLLIDPDLLDEKGVDPYTDSFTEEEFRKVFGSTVHRFTGVDYIDYYKHLGNNVEIVLSNDPAHILNYTKNVIVSDIHTRQRTRRRLAAAGAEKLFTLDQILDQPVDGSGCSEYGLLGSNKATEQRVKLFPRNCDEFVADLHDRLLAATGKNVEVMVYGDGCFKDPVGGIWEFADPVVSPAHTARLSGTPNEIKMKYFADNDLKDLNGAELEAAMKDLIRAKDNNLKGRMSSEGTTPRNLSDLVGSLSDLISGSGDRGTPVVYIKGYFTNFATK